jgi:hypothetical protein
MRRIFALAMVALLAMTIALAAIGCGKKQEETVETTPPPVETMPPDTSMMSDTTDTSMMHH